MTWSLSASGHYDDEQAENEFVNKLRETFKDVPGSANLYTQYQGQINLHEATTLQPEGGAQDGS